MDEEREKEEGNEIEWMKSRRGIEKDEDEKGDNVFRD